jgi:hypothetical protein
VNFAAESSPEHAATAAIAIAGTVIIISAFIGIALI